MCIVVYTNALPFKKKKKKKKEEIHFVGIRAVKVMPRDGQELERRSWWLVQDHNIVSWGWGEVSNCVLDTFLD